MSRMRPFSLVIALALSGLPASAQVLTPGHRIPGSLSALSKAAYTLDVGKDVYVYGFVDQLSVDVVVRILAPDSTEIASFDSPARGPEPFQFTSKVEGTYTIEVRPFEGAEGDYVMVLVASEPKATDPAALVDQLMTPFTGDDRPGAVISVVKEGRVVLAKGYGMANLAYGIPMTPETGMSIASVSKHFTAMALVLLEQDGRLSLDDDVRTHLPELKDFGTPVTLRNMLNHTSGYREILNFLPMQGSIGTDFMPREEIFRVVQRQPALQNAPGSEYNYNNTTFALLASVVERVSGQPFDVFLRERVFDPLGMERTRVKMRQGQVIPGSSQGYEAAKDGTFDAVMDFASIYGASSVNSTALDMTRWMANFRDGTVGGPEAVASLTTKGILTSGDTLNYALGLTVRKWRGRTLFTHTGGETSHRTWFGYFPEIDGGVFFSSNHPSFSLAIWTDIAGAFFADRLGPDAPVEATPEVADTTSTPPLTVEQLGAYAGRYYNEELETRYTLYVEGGKLMGRHRRVDPFPITHEKGESFKGGAWFFSSLTFDRDPAGAVTGFMAANSRTRGVWFRKIE